MIVRSSMEIVRVTLLALLLSCGTVSAQQDKEPSAAALATAKEIVVLKGAANILDPMVPGVVERVKFALMQINPMLQKPLEEVSAQLRKHFASRTEQLHAGLAKLYAERFTEAELAEVLKFYKSPIGQKVMVEEPQIFEANVEELRAWQDKFSEEVMARFRTEMRKRGHDL
jgi:hypothetical protein